MSSVLFEPVTFRGMQARNKLWAAPINLFEVINQDGVVTDWHHLHYSSLARGGTGVIVTEATAVSPEGRISSYDLGLWNDSHTEALKSLVHRVQRLGAKIAVQLAHAGRKGSILPKWGTDAPGPSLEMHGGWQTVAPSSLPHPGMAVPHALSRSDIAEIIESFCHAAVRAEQAGFDMIEVHAAHGYLLHQFLSPLSNKRTDEYGGTLPNRARLLLEVVKGIRDSISSTLPFMVRLSATDWTQGGLTLEDITEVVTTLAANEVDLVTISTGGITSNTGPVGPGYQVPYATAIKQSGSLPVAAVGCITEPVQAEQIVATGLADIAMVGRAFLRNPNFGIDAARVLGAEISYLPRPYLRAYPKS